MEPESQVVSTPPPPMPLTQAPNRQLLAPVWHTIFMVVLVVVFSYIGAHAPAPAGAVSQKELIVQYAVTIAFELFLLLLVWWGLRLNKNRMRDLIGGRWNTPEDFLLDIAIAAGFWIV